MANVYVTIEDCFEGDKLELIVQIGGYGETASFRFSYNTSPQEISQALKHGVLFLPEDMPLDISPGRRENILKLYEEAADNVPGRRRRV